MAIKKVLKQGTSAVLEKKNLTTGKKDVMLEKGNAVEVADKTLPAHILPSGKSVVGINKGLTLSLSNYQFARVDCWIMDTCDSDDKSKLDKLAELSQLIDEQLEYECAEIKNFADSIKK